MLLLHVPCHHDRFRGWRRSVKSTAGILGLLLVLLVKPRVSGAWAWSTSYAVSQQPARSFDVITTSRRKVRAAALAAAVLVVVGGGSWRDAKTTGGAEEHTRERQRTRRGKGGQEDQRGDRLPESRHTAPIREVPRVVAKAQAGWMAFGGGVIEP